MGGATRFMALLAAPFPSLVHPLRPSLIIIRRRLSSSTTSLRRLTLSPAKSPSLLNSASHQFHSQPNNINAYAVANDTHQIDATSPSHPWPEWTRFVNSLMAKGPGLGVAQDQSMLPDDAFVAYEELSDDFALVAAACLAFARERPNLLGLLSRRDIDVVVKNGTPYLFKSTLETARRMKAFLESDGGNVVEYNTANMVDLMKYILSYASKPTVSNENNSIYSRELVESSIRSLLHQLAVMTSGVPRSEIRTQENQVSGSYGQSARSFRQKIEMKRGDWICPKCSFMNFARNNKCLECEESRPKRQLTGGEWECPQCDFFNYGRNSVCLRCDFRRPVAESPNSVTPASGYNGVRSEMDKRLAENEEKAQRWFSKISQMNNVSDISSAASDEDFPEIMPLRKGENKFVVSTRKTPLERRLANSQYQRNSNNNGNAGTTDRTLDATITRSLDQILGHSSSVSGREGNSIHAEQNSKTDNPSSFSQPGSSDSQHSQGRNSSYVPFVPLPPDMFARKDQNSNSEGNSKTSSAPSGESQNSGESFQNSENPENQVDGRNIDKEQAEKSERWFKRVAELHNVKDLPSAISDEEFPEIMPMLKGENRFVVSKKKDRSLTSPAYKRQVARDQTKDSNFVPFVPFPPGYFARKPDANDSSTKPTGETPSSSVPTEKPDKLNDSRYEVADTSSSPRNYNQPSSSANSTSSNPYAYSSSANPTQNFSPQSSRSDIQTEGSHAKENASQSTLMSGDSPQQDVNQSYKSGWTGKSLEGSAVKEPDPLDMSEEAKAERWFKRVAQIKDISELSQIPDEDFPSIMPMRKGVNRFVVSKRKTPLERRLTSQQYRRNLPVVRSEPMKKETEEN